MSPPYFLDALKLDAESAAAAEDGLRRDFAQRLKEIETARVFAFRRLNLARATTDIVAVAADEKAAVADAIAMLRGKLNWSSDSQARAEVLSRFAAVAQAVFLSLAPRGDGAEAAGVPDVVAAFESFERWYRDTHPNPFWILLDTYIPETPVVDF